MCNNPLNGILPDSGWNHSTSLQGLFTYRCGIKGSIPDGIGNMSSLITISMADNHLTGSLPIRMQELQELQAIDLEYNNLSKITLNEICGFQYLEGVFLDANLITGSLPECLGNVTLRHLSLGSNRLNSSLPANIWNLKDIWELNISSNSLSGSLPPELSNLKVATTIDLSTNQLSSHIPNTIGDMQNLNYLSLSHNLLQGSMPESIGKMLSLQSLDFDKCIFCMLLIGLIM